MDQILINSALTGLMTAIAFVVKVIWQGLRDLQQTDIDMLGQIASTRLMMSDSYIKKEDFERMTSAIFSKLDKIENKLDGKVDRG